MGRLISLIYFYLVSIISIILLIIGLYNAVSYAVNVTQYDKYPLPYGNEDCSYLTQSSPVKPMPGTDGSIASLSAEEQQRQLRSCEERIEAQRKKQKVDDMKNAIYFTLIGIILLGLHFPVALKRSRDK